MYSGNHQGALNEYRNVGTTSSVLEADPHQLILLLMSGAMDAIAVARGHLQHGQVQEKGAQIGRAIAIIDGLRASLDRSANEELTDNLDELYQYMTRRLLQANVSGKDEWLAEVMDLLREIRSAWEAIPPELRHVSPSAVDAMARAV